MKRTLCAFLLAGVIVAVLSAKPSGTAHRILLDDKWGAIDSSGKIVLEPIYDYVYPFRDGVTVVLQGDYLSGKRAYALADGSFLTGFEFERAYYFFGTYAVVQKDGKEGYVDRTGHPVTNITFDYAEDFRNDIGIVRTGTWRDGKWGVIGPDAEVAIPIEYERITRTQDPDVFVFEQNGKSGLIDVHGEVLRSARFDSLYPNGAYLIAIERIDGENRYQVLDERGGVAIMPNDPRMQIRSVAGTFATVYEMGRYGLLGFDGAPIVEPKFESVFVLSDAVIAFGEGAGSGRKYGIFDASGQEIFPALFDWVSAFDENGLAIVVQNGKYGCIDEQGEVVVDLRFDGMREFSEGLAAVRVGEEWGYVDLSGNVVIEPSFDWVYEFSEGLAVFRVGDWETGKRGYIDTSGDIVIEPRFDWAYSFEGGVAHVAFGRHYDGTFGYIDTKGNYIWKPTH